MNATSAITIEHLHSIFTTDSLPMSENGSVFTFEFQFGLRLTSSISYYPCWGKILTFDKVWSLVLHYLICTTITERESNMSTTKIVSPETGTSLGVSGNGSLFSMSTCPWYIPAYTPLYSCKLLLSTPNIENKQKPVVKVIILCDSLIKYCRQTQLWIIILANIVKISLRR